MPMGPTYADQHGAEDSSFRDKHFGMSLSISFKSEIFSENFHLSSWCSLAFQKVKYVKNGEGTNN